MTTNPQWAGHPWATAPHRTVGRRASCQGCGEWCYRHDGCWCCNEAAYTWLLEEARWHAEDGRNRNPDSYWLGTPQTPRQLEPFPWERR